MFQNNNYIPAFWYSSNNFGDNLTHYLIKKISGKMPVLVERNDPCLKVMVTGSILNNDVTNAVVWGCGLAFSTDVVPPKTSILAVRGKLTGEILLKQNIEYNNVYGDPALLLPKIYKPKETNKKWKLGIIPHYVDAKGFYDRLNVSDIYLESLGIRVIDINDSVENVIDEINSCEKTISSTLHGLITSHAYGIPSQWVKFDNLIGGDDFKYLDYFSSINHTKNEYLDLRGGALNINTIIAISNHNFQKSNLDIDLNKLWNSCPFRF